MVILEVTKKQVLTLLLQNFSKNRSGWGAGCQIDLQSYFRVRLPPSFGQNSKLTPLFESLINPVFRQPLLCVGCGF